MLLILVRTGILYLLLSCLLRSMGKRQIGELEVGEMITTLLLSEVIALPIADTNLSLLAGVIPAVFICCAEILLAALKNRSVPLKRIVEGEPVYLIYKGRIVQQELRENRISLNELLCSLRGLGVFAPETVEYAILETNGKVSVLQKEDAVPPTLGVLHGKKDEGLSHPLVIDGTVQMRALRRCGLSEEWLGKVLKKERLRLDEVFLLTRNDAGDVRITKKEIE